MSQWSSAKAKRVLAALLRIGWSIKRETGSHKVLSRPDWPDIVFAFHDRDEIGRRCWPALRNIPDLNQKTVNPHCGVGYQPIIELRRLSLFRPPLLPAVQAQQLTLGHSKL